MNNRLDVDLNGGIFTTAADMSRLWQALFAGKIVPPRWVAEMIRPRSDVPSEKTRHGLGFWPHPMGREVKLVGGDALPDIRRSDQPCPVRRSSRSWMIRSAGAAASSIRSNLPS